MAAGGGTGAGVLESTLALLYLWGLGRTPGAPCKFRDFSEPQPLVYLPRGVPACQGLVMLTPNA